MIEAVRHNLTNLLNFQGRDSRSMFWFYILFLFLLYFVLSIVIGIIGSGMMFMSIFSEARHGTHVDQTVIQQQMAHGMGRFVGVSKWFSVVVSVLGTFLLAASFTRRLHDSNRPGWIAALVFAAYLISVAMTLSMIGAYADLVGKMDFAHPQANQQAMLAMQRTMALRGLFGYVPMIALIVFGVWPSSDGDNRYGPEPEHL